MEKKKSIEWYNNPNVITWLIIGAIGFIILSSQSFSADGEIDALALVQNILNHNITYMIMLVYFVFIKTKFGKKYFDYSNILMLIFFFIIFVTSVLTSFQSLSLVSLLTIGNNFLIFIYFFHTFLRGTRFWKEFNLGKSPFNELSNEWYFNAIMVIEVTLFAVSLISISTVNGTILATFDCIYVILFARYVYLYGVYLDSIKKNSKNIGNFDEYREKLVDVTEEIVDKANQLIDDGTEKIGEVAKEVVDKANELIEDSSKKIEDASKKVVEKEKVDDNDKDEKNKNNKKEDK